jgi:hypothetical protein
MILKNFKNKKIKIEKYNLIFLYKYKLILKIHNYQKKKIKFLPIDSYLVLIRRSSSP